MRRVRVFTLCSLALAACDNGVVDPSDVSGGALTVMTQNVYVGSDIESVLAEVGR